SPRTPAPASRAPATPATTAAPPRGAVRSAAGRRRPARPGRRRSPPAPRRLQPPPPRGPPPATGPPTAAARSDALTPFPPGPCTRLLRNVGPLPHARPCHTRPYRAGRYPPLREARGLHPGPRVLHP